MGGERSKDTPAVSPLCKDHSQKSSTTKFHFQASHTATSNCKGWKNTRFSWAATLKTAEVSNEGGGGETQPGSLLHSASPLLNIPPHLLVPKCAVRQRGAVSDGRVSMRGAQGMVTFLSEILRRGYRKGCDQDGQNRSFVKKQVAEGKAQCEPP